MPAIEFKKVSTRLGQYFLVSIDGAILLTNNKTRVNLLSRLGRGAATAGDLSESLKVSYTTVLDEIDVLKKAGIVEQYLYRFDGQRRLMYRLVEDLTLSMKQAFDEGGKRNHQGVYPVRKRPESGANSTR